MSFLYIAYFLRFQVKVKGMSRRYSWLAGIVRFACRLKLYQVKSIRQKV